MRHFLVTFFNSGDHSRWDDFTEILKSKFGCWAAEPDQGLFFVSSELDAEEILQQIHSEMELSFAQFVYVFELTGSIAGFGTSNVLQAIEERVHFGQ